MTTTEPRQRHGECRDCGQTVALDMFGRLRTHAASASDGEPGGECDGVGATPKFDQTAWEQGARDALERAIGWHRMRAITDWTTVEHDANTLNLAEEDAIHALKNLAEACEQIAEELINPDEPQDERRPFRYSSLAGEFEAATIAMAHLASERNRVRPSR